MKYANLNVLIVDDIKTVRTMLTKNLNALGIEKIQATDSLLSAWSVLTGDYEKKNPIDIIFCDWNMPKGDGIDLLKKIRSEAQDELRLTKFVMITGSNDKVLEEMDYGANNIIHKPFSAEIIKNKLELIFGI